MADEWGDQLFVRSGQEFSLTLPCYMWTEYRFDGCHLIFEITVTWVSMEIGFFSNISDAYFLAGSIPAKAIDPCFLLLRSACKPFSRNCGK